MAQNNDRKRGPDGGPSGQHPNKMRRPDEVGIKFLLPNVVVGALLSRKAAALKRIRDQTCFSHELVLKLSGKDQFYPGTGERMIALEGSPPMVHRACCMLQDQIIDDPFLVTDEAGANEQGPRQGQMKIAVSDRAASKIIGSRGAVIKDISNHFNIAISITPTSEIIVPDERVVTILGPSRNVFDALEPIIYQISLQQSQVAPEFDYYDEYTKTKDMEDDAEKEDETAKEDDTTQADEPSVTAEDEAKVEADEQQVGREEIKEGSVEKDETPAVEPSDEEPKSDQQEIESPCDDNQDVDESKAEEKFDEKKTTSEDVIKKLLKDPRKDGRWVWQNDRTNRPSWVWVEHQGKPAAPAQTPFMNHSQTPRFRGHGRRW